MAKVAVVTGSNKGIGFGIVKGLCQKFDGVVYLTSRDESRGREAVSELKKIGLNPEYHQLDVTDRSSVERFSEHLAGKYGGIDILFNNAAVLDAEVESRTYEDAKRVVDTNYRSLLTMKELIYPLVRPNGRIVNSSSDCGHLSNVKNEYWIRRLSSEQLTEADVNEFVDWYLESIKNGSFESADLADGATIASYRVAKVALSAITRVHQRELGARNICVNAVHLGLVRTDMTHGAGFFSVDEAAAIPIYLALDAPATVRGAYVWFDRRLLDWRDANADYYFKIASIGS